MRFSGPAMYFYNVGNPLGRKKKSILKYFRVARKLVLRVCEKISYSEGRSIKMFTHTNFFRFGDLFYFSESQLLNLEIFMKSLTSG